MFVLVTGGTGYLGSHTVAALTTAAHRGRVLARSPDRVAAALEPLGVSGVETSIGDVTDPVAVESALDRCEAVVHAASVFSMDPRRADEVRAVKVRSTDTVLGSAHRLALDPTVHVSSELAPGSGLLIGTPARLHGPAPHLSGRDRGTRWRHRGGSVVLCRRIASSSSSGRL
jgi:nucleoside-diphosphate-sugar epimerase